MKRSLWTGILAVCAVMIGLCPAKTAAAEELQGDLTAPPQKQVIRIEEDLADNDSLLTMYLEQNARVQSQSSRALKRVPLRNSLLSGADRKLYDALKEKIAAVADGKLSSTSFQIPAEDIVDAGKVHQKYTAADLGISSIVTVTNGTAAFADGAIPALYKKIGFDSVQFGRVIDCLIADQPYELYWFDKTQSNAAKYMNPAVGAVQTESGWTIYLSGDTPVLTVELAVAKEFSSNPGSSPSTSADTSKTGKAKTAASNAQKIVSAHSSENDYKKLQSYCREICTRTEYNLSAASNESTPYGNPWQLIWVFDGDTATKVVCEGYAKAFQFLCDLSSFKNSSIRCCSVTGIMSGGTGAGKHMWNILTMDDGKNYLADITNCDTGSVGADDLLFLAPASSGAVSGKYYVKAGSAELTYGYDAETKSLYTASMLTLSTKAYIYCSHQWDTGKVTKAPTCVKAGVKTYTCLKDSSHKKTEEIAPTGIHTMQALPAKAATCTASGLKEGSKCSACGEVFKKQEVIPALGHSWNKGVVTKAPKVGAAGVKTFTCTRCGKTRTETIKALALKKGEIRLSGKLKFKVTNPAADGSGTVALIGSVSKKSKLKKVTIPATVTLEGTKYQVTAIGAGAFKGYKKLKTITIKSLTIKSIGKKAVKSIYKKAKIKVPKAKLKAYKKLFKKKTGFTKKMKLKGF